jgi:uncharacterized protein YukE
VKKLSKALSAKKDDFLADLNEAAEKARDYYDNRSEAWQDGDAGTNYLAWIEQLEAAVEALEDLPEGPDQ